MRTMVSGVRTGLVLLLLAGVAGACGEEEKAVQQRGVAPPPGGGGKAKGKGADAPGAEGSAGGEADGEGEEAEAPPPRPRPVLTREDFSLATRDPFQNFLGSQVVELEPDRPRAQRDVKMSEYAFEDLKLVAIVRSGRGIVPRALFVASDGKSQTIKQGEYFSRAEVLLAAVNRDYVEIEVVDEELASNLGLSRGERRAIYLKNE
ncbi:MAG: hypothetical protein D6705_00710 [Deltaproteobacteria bacterium]|nr:MAG: hypothetical protein D6705_00710 [Deltaproteobacteria bacterium]